MRDTNELLSKKNYSFILTMLFSFLTFGLYFWYHEYKLTKELHALNNIHDRELVEILVPLLTFFGLWFLVDGYQQDLLNEKIAIVQGSKKRDY